MAFAPKLVPEIDFRVNTIFGNAFLGSKSVRFPGDDVTVDTVERRRDVERKVYLRFVIFLAEFPFKGLVFAKEIDPALRRRFEGASKREKER